MHSCEVAETGHLFEQRERLTGRKTKGQGGFLALREGEIGILRTWRGLRST